MSQLIKILNDLNFIEEFEKAENAIKLVERLHEELVIPAINELRYSAYHIKEYLKNNNDEELKKAIGHCRRARYDAYEAGILALIKEFQLFKKDYRKIVISEVIKEYIEYNKKFEEIINFINSTKKETKEEIYQEYEKKYNELLKIINLLSGAREELNKKIQERQHKILLLWATILGSSAAIMSFLYLILK